jgi:hypothetical protein
VDGPTSLASKADSPPATSFQAALAHAARVVEQIAGAPSSMAWIVDGPAPTTRGLGGDAAFLDNVLSKKIQSARPSACSAARRDRAVDRGLFPALTGRL